jgi:hypothetical protein
MNVSASNVLGTCCTIVWYLSQTSRRDYEKLEASLSLVRCDYFQFLEFVIARPPLSGCRCGIQSNTFGRLGDFWANSNET